MNPSNGKGSTQRPAQISRERFDSEYDRIFGTKRTRPRLTVVNVKKDPHGKGRM